MRLAGNPVAVAIVPIARGSFVPACVDDEKFRRRSLKRIGDRQNFFVARIPPCRTPLVKDDGERLFDRGVGIGSAVLRGG